MSLVAAGHSRTLVSTQVSLASAAVTQPCSVTVAPFSYFFPSAWPVADSEDAPADIPSARTSAIAVFIETPSMRSAGCLPLHSKLGYTRRTVNVRLDNF